MSQKNEQAMEILDLEESLIAKIAGYFWNNEGFNSHDCPGMYRVHSLNDEQYLGIFQKMVLERPYLFLPNARDAFTVVSVDPELVDLGHLATTGHINIRGDTYLGKITNGDHDIAKLGRRDNIFHATDTRKSSRLRLIPREGHPFTDEVVSYYKARDQERTLSF